MTSLWFAISVSSPVLVSDDHSRVKLENSENDYINASLVMMEEAQRAYILSQVWCTLSLNSTVWVCADTIYRRICMKGFTLMFCEVLICVSSAFTGAFEKYLWSFLANGLGAVFQSCYYAQQSYWKGICKYDYHHLLTHFYIPIQRSDGEPLQYQQRMAYLRIKTGNWRSKVAWLGLKLT